MKKETKEERFELERLLAAAFMTDIIAYNYHRALLVLSKRDLHMYSFLYSAPAPATVTS
jgi:hypothetical protein